MRLNDQMTENSARVQNSTVSIHDSAGKKTGNSPRVAVAETPMIRCYPKKNGRAGV
jgi:hypothetical protein